jgi:hypothetical protein
VTLFLRLLEDEDKPEALRTALRASAAGTPDLRVFEADPAAFARVPGAPFAYWVGDQLRRCFERLHPLQAWRNCRRNRRQGTDEPLEYHAFSHHARPT